MYKIYNPRPNPGSKSAFQKMIDDRSRVADPVHFRPDLAPDPDPANQNFKTGSGSRILLALKESIQTSKFFSHQTYYLLLICE